jgi:hypothetical protein
MSLLYPNLLLQTINIYIEFLFDKKVRISFFWFFVLCACFVRKKLALWWRPNWFLFYLVDVVQILNKMC